jgi:hypothetical protein
MSSSKEWLGVGLEPESIRESSATLSSDVEILKEYLLHEKCTIQVVEIWDLLIPGDEASAICASIAQSHLVDRIEILEDFEKLPLILPFFESFKGVLVLNPKSTDTTDEIFYDIIASPALRIQN